MDEEKRKRLIVFTSQSFKQKGIRAVRMDAIARDLNVSKRTIYEVYKTKENLINVCLSFYTDRIRNLFSIIGYNSTDTLSHLLGTSEAFVANLYKGEDAFWNDITGYYPYVYATIQGIWYEELERRMSACRAEGFVMYNLDVRAFLDTFTSVLYSARMAQCTSDMLTNSALFMLRGTMTVKGINAMNSL
mgnify:FL=1